MRKELEGPKVENIGVAIVEQMNELKVKIYNVYLLNLSEDIIEGIMITSKGYGENLKTERTFEALSNLVYDATGIDADDNVINENSTIGIDGYNLGTFQGGANFLLDRTAASGNFTNVGEQVILETATFYNIISDPITGAKLSIPQTFENSFDSTLSTFDSSTKTFDSTL